MVNEGDLLFEIDPRPFQAALDQANGQLAQAQAQLGKTELDVQRLAPLAKENAISQQELDNARRPALASEAEDQKERQQTAHESGCDLAEPTQKPGESQ